MVESPGPKTDRKDKRRGSRISLQTSIIASLARRRGVRGLPNLGYGDAHQHGGHARRRGAHLRIPAPSGANDRRDRKEDSDGADLACRPRTH